MAESFGRLLQRYRAAAGFSQEQLAELAGVSTNAISSLERGLRQAPHSATLDLLMAALELEDSARLQFVTAARAARAQRTLAYRPDSPSDRPSEATLNNLPPELTSFVDREAETAEIKELLRAHHLVTVVGTGGVGKTRCATKIASEILGEFIDGAWLAELALISDPALVTTVIARTIKLEETPNRPLLDTLLVYLRRKRLLLVLDNCEHLIAEAASTAAAILHDCPNVRILATSRESFNIAGEHVYRMPSLSVPSPSMLSSADEMSKHGSVRLFSDRAFSADNRFSLTNESATHVADICRRLDGIPLALELAAARVTALSPKQLAQKLDERFRVLTGGDRSALPRHQTMRALIDWSYDLLSDDERALFRKLSVFSGGFTLESAAIVCGKGEADEIAVLDLLSSLVAKSLVQAETGEENTRYRLLESTRQYARDKLSRAHEEDVVTHAHARAFFGLAQQLSDAWETLPDRAWLAKAEPELENFRAALAWAFGPRGDALLGQRLAGTLGACWFPGSPVEGRRWLQAARRRATEETPPAVLGTLDFAEAQAAAWLMEHKESLTLAERALAHYRDVVDPRGVALAQLRMGSALAHLGNIPDGLALLDCALEALRSLGARRSVIVALGRLTEARILAGEIAGARRCFDEAMDAARAFGAERYAAVVAQSLAEAEFRDGNADEAVRRAEEATHAIARASGTVFGFGTFYLANVRPNMAAYLVALRRFDEARTAARDAVTTACDVQWPLALARALQHLAAIAALCPDSGRSVIENRRKAAHLIGYVDKQLDALGALREYTDQQEYDAIIPALINALGEDEVAKLIGIGSAWSERQAITEAMLV